jgi:hypothetical protein
MVRQNSSALLQARFSSLAALPAWGSSAWYGSWLRLHFGKPRLLMLERRVDSAAKVTRRRQVHVVGDHELWVEMCNWRVLEGKRRRFHSGQRRMSLLRAGFFLEGRRLEGVRVSLQPLAIDFAFEDAVVLVTEPYEDAEVRDSMWHLYSGHRYLVCEAGGKLGYRQNSKGRLGFAKLAAVELAF